MEKTKHTVKVAGFSFKVVSEDSSEYMSALAREVDLKIDALLKNICRALHESLTLKLQA